MRKIFLTTIIIVTLCGVSCKKYLNINSNPNSTANASPSLVLPLAIVNTASLVSNMNDYGGQTAGYAANAGGYGGYGAMWTYDYAPSQGEGFWDFGYQILENYQYIINATEGSNLNANFNAAAKIMKVYVFQMLVDEFNDVPFTQSLQGGNLFTPKYDSASQIYPQLATLIDSAIAEINNASQPDVLGKSDPMFGGDMLQWKQFGNSLKLRLIIRASASVNFANTSFSSDGFLTGDAIVNPGYTLAQTSSGSQVSPSWNAWASNYTGARVGQAWIPTTYVFGFYDGTKLADPDRGSAMFYQFPSTPTNQLGVSPPNNTLTSPAQAGAWYSGQGSGTSLGNAIGVLKGPNMGEPLMLLAESEFLQAEADVRGILNQDAATDFNNGIVASFTYLFEGPDDNPATGAPGAATAAAAYMTNNSSSYLVNFSLATTPAQQTEAIITQKYIAMDFINGEEAWSEYRRTGYPVSSPTTINNPYGSMASTQSQATRPDHLPTRLPYPASEAATNGTNVPQNVSVYTSTIFWAH